MTKDWITILVAEDNISNFKLFETILKKDFHILHAWNGVEAVELFKTHSPHILLMDVNMPMLMLPMSSVFLTRGLMGMLRSQSPPNA